jgi:hypothetical protein
LAGSARSGGESGRWAAKDRDVCCSPRSLARSARLPTPPVADDTGKSSAGCSSGRSEGRPGVG